MSECPLCGESTLCTYGCEYTYGVFGICDRCTEDAARCYMDRHCGEVKDPFKLEFDDVPKPTKYKKKPIPQKIRVAVFERDKYRCLKCGDHKNLACDHIIPEKCGGDAVLDNLQTLCQQCNNAKMTDTVDYRRA